MTARALPTHHSRWSQPSSWEATVGVGAVERRCAPCIQRVPSAAAMVNIWRDVCYILISSERTMLSKSCSRTSWTGIDERLIAALASFPRAGMLQLAREVGVARNTAQARFDRLLEAGVITGFGPELDLRRVGYGVSAFVSLEIAQGRAPAVDEHLADIPEVVEAYMTTGPVGPAVPGGGPRQRPSRPGHQPHPGGSGYNPDDHVAGAGHPDRAAQPARGPCRLGGIRGD